YNEVGTSTLGYGTPPGSLGLRDQPKPLPESGVLVPSNMIAIGDASDQDDGDIVGNLLEPEDWISNRHNGAGNVVFCDGHIEFAKQTNWMRAAEEPRKRWNRDNQPHPETWR